jgi:flagellar hook-basal body complex protein FliE
MSISKIGGNYAAIVERAAALRKAATQKTTQTPSGGSFKMEPIDGKMRGEGLGQKLGSALDTLSEMQNSADSMVIDLASGKDVNIHNTMIELEKADIALKYTVQLRNRALSAYDELMRLSV